MKFLTLILSDKDLYSLVIFNLNLFDEDLKANCQKISKMTCTLYMHFYKKIYINF